MADAALTFLLENVKKLLGEEQLDLISGAENEVKMLKGELELMIAVLEESAEKRAKWRLVLAISQLEKQIVEAVYEAKDALDAWLTQKSGKSSSLNNIDLAKKVKDLRINVLKPLLQALNALQEQHASGADLGTAGERLEKKWDMEWDTEKWTRRFAPIHQNDQMQGNIIANESNLLTAAITEGSLKPTDPPKSTRQKLGMTSSQPRNDEIFVRFKFGDTSPGLPVAVNSAENASQLRSVLQETTGVNTPDSFIFFHKNKRVKENRSFKAQKICDGATIEIPRTSFQQVTGTEFRDQIIDSLKDLALPELAIGSPEPESVE